MKKVLLAFDGVNFSEGAFEFVRRLNGISPLLVTGVFLPQTDYSSLWSYSAGKSEGLFIPYLEDETVSVIEKNMERFESLCRQNQIEYRTHKVLFDFAMPMLKKETRFADLMILGSESFYDNIGLQEPNYYLKDALHEAECPVLIVPEEFGFPSKNILAYDGSESSVYAIKQFAYLFPELSKNDSVLMYVQTGQDISFPDETLIEELCARHYDNLSLFKLAINPNKYLGLWTSEKEGSILVSGAYGRSSFSQLFKKSFVSDVIKEHKLPVFIAHR